MFTVRYMFSQPSFMEMNIQFIIQNLIMSTFSISSKEEKKYFTCLTYYDIIKAVKQCYLLNLGSRNPRMSLKIVKILISVARIRKIQSRSSTKIREVCWIKLHYLFGEVRWSCFKNSHVYPLAYDILYL